MEEGDPVRVLFLADSHLGFDLPVRPRVERRRRGHDFFANYHEALNDAMRRQVDLVVHGGDVFYRSRVPATLVQDAFQPLKRVAEAGIPVFVVPGNHERSRMPHPMLTIHPGIRVFERPTTFVTRVRGVRVALSGFPYCRKDVRTRFTALLDRTGWQRTPADVRLLCVHHCFEGASVGPADFTFRSASDVIRAADVPAPFAAVLTGHVHRHQILTRDLRGNALPTPVLYPGSIERTSFAEMEEPKGYLLLELTAGREEGGTLDGWQFAGLPARPMIVRELEAGGADEAVLESRIRQVLDSVPGDAVLRLRVRGSLSEGARAVLSAAHLRALAPRTMNVDVVLADEPRTPRRAARRGGDRR